MLKRMTILRDINLRLAGEFYESRKWAAYNRHMGKAEAYDRMIKEWPNHQIEPTPEVSAASPEAVAGAAHLSVRCRRNRMSDPPLECWQIKPNKDIRCCYNCVSWRRRKYTHCQHSGPFGGDISNDSNCKFKSRHLTTACSRTQKTAPDAER